MTAETAIARPGPAVEEVGAPELRMQSRSSVDCPEESRLCALGFWSLTYLLTPHVIFAAGWLKPGIAVIHIGALAVVWLSAVRRLRPFSARAFGGLRTWLWPSLPAAAVVLVWMALSGIGGIGHQNVDYPVANSLLKDLMTRPWPLDYEVHGAEVGFVYYVAYYLPAALVGKWLGWAAAQGFLFAWSITGVALALAWLGAIAKVRPKVTHALILVFVFVFFSGLDLFGALYLGRPIGIGDHIEWWARPHFQFSSHTTQLFWVPQHAIGAWIVTGALVAGSRVSTEFLRFLFILPATCLLWSPFATVGLVPVVLLSAALIWRKGHLGTAISWQAVLAILPIAAVSVAYFLSSYFEFPRGPIWLTAPGFWVGLLVVFWLVEFGVLAVWYLPVRHVSVHLWMWTILAVVCLLAIPLYKMGAFNDFAMRASIPSLYILCAGAVALLVAERHVMRWQKAGITAILALGGLTAGQEMARSLTHYRVAPPSFETVRSFPELSMLDVAQRSGSKRSVFFRFLAAGGEAR